MRDPQGGLVALQGSPMALWGLGCGRRGKGRRQGHKTVGLG